MEGQKITTIARGITSDFAPPLPSQPTRGPGSVHVDDQISVDDQFTINNSGSARGVTGARRSEAPGEPRGFAQRFAEVRD